MPGVRRSRNTLTTASGSASSRLGSPRPQRCSSTIRPGISWNKTDETATAQADYIYLGDRPLATFQPSNGKTYFLHDDRLGTPQRATDNTQAIAWSADYQPFGYTSTGIGLIVQDLRLPGQEFEVETWWNHNGSRDYASTVGRYLQPDPIGITAAAKSFYVYVGNNPIGRIDLSGLSWSDRLYSLSNAAAGFGDALSFGATRYVRNALGSDDTVSTCSAAYSAGFLSGAAYGVGLAVAIGAGGATVAESGIAQDAIYSGYQDITAGTSSVRNVATSVTQTEFEQNLTASGFTAEPVGPGTMYTGPQGEQYFVRNFSNAGGPTADYYAAGSSSINLKIRLGR